MGKINSKQKGARAERDWAKTLRDAGFPARRGCQYAGGPDSPDVVCESLPFHWEVKHVEKLNIWNAIEQCNEDAGEGETPVVVFKKNHKNWQICIDAQDFLNIIKDKEN